MGRFPTLDALAKSFIRAYYTTNVYQVRNLPKFYADDAVLIRGGHTFSFTADRGLKDIPLSLANESTLTIVRYTPVSAASTVLITAEGKVETPLSNSSFSQTFILAEVRDRLWIKGDFLTQVDEHFFDALDSDQYYEAEVPARESPIPRRQPSKGGQRNPFVWSPDQDEG
jgi:hypothetical protein